MAVSGGELYMTKPISAMTEEEKRRLLSTQNGDDEDLYEEEEEEIEVPNQASGWHESTKDRQKFISSLDKKPKRNFIARMINDDDPNTLSKLPKGKKIQSQVPGRLIDPDLMDPEFDINEPVLEHLGASQPAKRDLSWLHSAGRIILWFLHAFLMVGILYFTYYMITLVKSPRITDFAAVGTLLVIISIQISLFSVNSVLGSVIRR